MGTPGHSGNGMTLMVRVIDTHIPHTQDSSGVGPSSFPDIKDQLAESGRARIRVSRQRKQLQDPKESPRLQLSPPGTTTQALLKPQPRFHWICPNYHVLSFQVASELMSLAPECTMKA